MNDILRASQHERLRSIIKGVNTTAPYKIIFIAIISLHFTQGVINWI